MEENGSEEIWKSRVFRKGIARSPERLLREESLKRMKGRDPLVYKIKAIFDVRSSVKRKLV